jgi:hypothetical protein
MGKSKDYHARDHYKLNLKDYHEPNAELDVLLHEYKNLFAQHPLPLPTKKGGSRRKGNKRRSNKSNKNNKSNKRRRNH